MHIGMKSCATIVLSLVLTLGSVTSAGAQIDRAAIEGRVSDESGGVLPGRRRRSAP
jgi:hypothetical protein